MKISGSIVLYNSDELILSKAIEAFFEGDSLGRKLYLIDNSPTDRLKDLAIRENITYIWNPNNPGFGGAHNIAILNTIKEGYDYHFVINPDISVKYDVITPMIQYMEEDHTIGMMMPEVLNSDGSHQYLPKLLPSPYSILMRKLKFPKKLYNKFITTYELRNIENDLICNVPILSGCFTLFRVSVLKEIGGYDDRFFMYFEDWDLSRRIHQKYKTLYFPKVSIYHDYASGANHNYKLFKIFVHSAIKYFNKWGWFFDKERVLINRKTLEQFINSYL